MHRPFKKRGMREHAVGADAIIQERDRRAIGQPVEGNCEFPLLGLDRERGPVDVFERQDDSVGSDLGPVVPGPAPMLVVACFLAMAAAFFAAAFLPRLFSPPPCGSTGSGSSMHHDR